MTELDDPVKVEQSKVAYMENLVGFLTKCFGQDTQYPPVLEEYLDYVNDMDFDSDPDYASVREMFEKCIVSMGKTSSGKFVWNKPKPRGRKNKKVENVSVEDENSKPSLEDGDDDSNTGETVRRSRRIAEADKEEEVKDDTDTPDTSNSKWNWERVLSQNPERSMRKKKPVELSLKQADFERRQKESLENPTPEMTRILMLIQELETVREEMKDQDQLQEFNKQRQAWLKERFTALEEADPCDNNPAMQEILDKINNVTRDPEEVFVFKPVVKDVSEIM